MPLSHGLPRRQVLLLDPETRDHFLRDLREDLRIFEKLQQAAFPGKASIVDRSLFKLPCVQQLVLCLKSEGWKVTPKVEEFVRKRATRFIGSQLAEDGFNKIKAHVDKGRNTVSCAASAMAAAVDSHVVSETHHFTEVDRTTVPLQRNLDLDPTVFKAKLRKSDLHPELKALDLGGVAGVGQPTWHSPGPGAYCQAFVDLEVCRQADGQDKMESMNKRFFSCLFTKHVVFRRKGAHDYYLGMGCLAQSLAVGWPVRSLGPMCWEPIPNAKRKLIAVFDVSQWEAATVEYRSPLHQAVMHELAAIGAIDQTRKTVNVKAAHAQTVDIARASEVEGIVYRGVRGEGGSGMDGAGGAP
eukprot:9474735-Pyramimonas_sp.AAC.1